MDHFRRHKIEPARAEIELLPVAHECARPVDHGVCFIRRVPVLAHVNRLWRVYQQTGRMRFGIDMQNANFRRVFTEIRQNFVPFQIRQIFKLWRLRERLARTILRLRIECERQRRCNNRTTKSHLHKWIPS